MARTDTWDYSKKLVNLTTNFRFIQVLLWAACGGSRIRDPVLYGWIARLVRFRVNLFSIWGQRRYSWLLLNINEPPTTYYPTQLQYAQVLPAERSAVCVITQSLMITSQLTDCEEICINQEYRWFNCHFPCINISHRMPLNALKWADNLFWELADWLSWHKKVGKQRQRRRRRQSQARGLLIKCLMNK